MFRDFGVLKFQPVLEVINLHKTGNRDAIFLQNEALLVEVGPFDERTEIDASIGDGDCGNRGSPPFTAL